MSHDGFGVRVNIKATFSELKESLDHLERTVECMCGGRTEAALTWGQEASWE